MDKDRYQELINELQYKLRNPPENSYQEFLRRRLKHNQVTKAFLSDEIDEDSYRELSTYEPVNGVYIPSSYNLRDVFEDARIYSLIAGQFEEVWVEEEAHKAVLLESGVKDINYLFETSMDEKGKKRWFLTVDAKLRDIKTRDLKRLVLDYVTAPGRENMSEDDLAKLPDEIREEDGKWISGNE